MTASPTHQLIERLVHDPSMSRDDTIKQLKQLLFDARAGQEAATQHPTSDDDGLNNKLRAIELALLELGGDPETGNATAAARL